METEPPYVAVVGGANVDIEGHAFGPLVPHDSNPGRIRRAPGGVGRNIAHDLAKLGVPTRLLTALGRDADGDWLHQLTGAAGVDMSDTLWCDAHTAVYLSVLDASGEMAVAVNDMTVLAHLDEAAVAAREATLRSAASVVIDCNLSADTIAAITELGCMLFVDTVSTAKAERILPHLHRVHTLKPNRIETELLTGMEISDDRSLRTAAQRLLDKGVQRVVVSLGADGALAADHSGIDTHRPPPLPVSSVTGAGDALMAGLVRAHLDGLSTAQATRFGLAAAAITAASPDTIADELDPVTVADLMESCS